MLASVLIDAGIFIVLLGLGVSIIMVARVAKIVKAHLPGMQLEIGQVNRAVNHVAEGEPTLIQQVGHIRSCITAMTEKFDSVHARIDALEASHRAASQHL